MSYIAVELRVVETLAPSVARSLGIDEDRVLAGLVRLWHRCWSLKSTTVTLGQLAGVFGQAGIDAVAMALVDHGLLESLDGAWRVRGADRYLRLDEARRKGGNASKSNLIPGGPKRTKKAGLRAEPQPSPSPATTSADPGLPLGSTSALSLSTEHRALSTESTTLRAKPAVAPKPRESDRLLEVFREVTGTAYAFNGVKDGTALAALLKHATLEEILTRWRTGLQATGWEHVATVAQLRAKWNDLAAMKSNDVPDRDWRSKMAHEFANIDPDDPFNSKAVAS